MTRPRLEGLFNGSTTSARQLTWLNGQPGAPETPPIEPPARPAAPEPTGLFDPVALAERYFALMQALLDLQRECGLRLAHQVAELPGMNRLRP